MAVLGRQQSVIRY